MQLCLSRILLSRVRLEDVAVGASPWWDIDQPSLVGQDFVKRVPCRVFRPTEEKGFGHLLECDFFSHTEFLLPLNHHARSSDQVTPLGEGGTGKKSASFTPSHRTWFFVSSTDLVWRLTSALMTRRIIALLFLNSRVCPIQGNYDSCWESR